MMHQPEQRPGGDEGEGRGGQQHRPAADAVGEPAHGHHQRDQHGHADGVDVERARRRNAVGKLQPAHDVDEHQVEADGVEDGERGEPDQQRAVAAHRLEERRAPDFLGGLLLLDAATQHEAREADQKADHERDAPAPGFQRRRRHRRSQNRARRRAEQDAADRAAAAHGADHGASIALGVLDHEDDGGGVFAADRQALDHAQEREQDRRGHAQGLVARQHADQEGRDGHCRHRER